MGVSSAERASLASCSCGASPPDLMRFTSLNACMHAYMHAVVPKAPINLAAADALIAKPEATNLPDSRDNSYDCVGKAPDP
jgi:hypothetical protein